MKRALSYGKYGLVAAMGLLFAAMGQAAPIAPSQLTPRSIAPPAAPPMPIPSLAPPERSPGLHVGDGLVVRVGKVRIDGGFAELATDNTLFMETVAHKTLTIADLFDAAHHLEQAYNRRGYILVRVSIPPQSLAPDQPIRILVIDGFVEALDVDHVTPAVRDAVSARLSTLLNRRHVTEYDLERRLLLAGDLAGVHLRSALVRGTQVGGTRLLLESTFDRFSATTVLDNALPSSLGTWEWNASASLNSLLGLGDQLYLSVGSQFDMGRFGFPTAPFGIIGGGLTVPVGKDGVSVGADIVHSRAEPDPLPGVPSTIGDFTRAQLHLVVPLVERRTDRLTMSGTLAAIQQSLRAPSFDVGLNRDRYLAVRLGLDWQHPLTTSPISLNLILSQGLQGRDGSATLPLSRQDASSQFTTLDATARVGAEIPTGTGFSIVARGQASFGQPQMQSEQFGLDSPDGVSAFPAGSFSVDSGISLRGEISHALPASLMGVTVQPYLFASLGWGWLEKASAVEQHYVTAHAMGAGARFVAQETPAGAAIGFELGFTGGRGRPDGARASLTVSASY
jgi:hemolysin activation/secretion protein